MRKDKKKPIFLDENELNENDSLIIEREQETTRNKRPCWSKDEVFFKTKIKSLMDMFGNKWCNKIIEDLDLESLRNSIKESKGLNDKLSEEVKRCNERIEELKGMIQGEIGYRKNTEKEPYINSVKQFMLLNDNVMEAVINLIKDAKKNKQCDISTIYSTVNALMCFFYNPDYVYNNSLKGMNELQGIVSEIESFHKNEYHIINEYLTKLGATDYKDIGSCIVDPSNCSFNARIHKHYFDEELKNGDEFHCTLKLGYCFPHLNDVKEKALVL